MARISLDRLRCDPELRISDLRREARSPYNKRRIAALSNVRMPIDELVRAFDREEDFGVRMAATMSLSRRVDGPIVGNPMIEDIRRGKRTGST